MSVCASCCCPLAGLQCTGYSGIYNPSGPEIELCEPCFFREDELIEAYGTNDLPGVLEKYRHVLAGYS